MCLIVFKIKQCTIKYTHAKIIIMHNAVILNDSEMFLMQNNNLIMQNIIICISSAFVLQCVCPFLLSRHF